MESYILPFFVAAFISLIMTPLVRRLAIKIGALDIPKDDRRVHNKPMPLIGGLAIYIAVIVASLLFLPIDKSLTSIIVGGTIIVCSGIIDDMKCMSTKVKLIFQILAGLILIFGDVKVDFITNPFSSNNILLDLKWFSIPITLFWIVGITNTLNLIEGLD